MINEEIERVEITFNEKKLYVEENKIISAALWNEGITTGFYCGIGRCQSCLAEVNGKKALACLTQVKQGMSIRVANHE